MSAIRPDLIECWVFRVGPSGIELLLIRRAPDRIFPGIWQPVTGGLEPGERPAIAALREVEEETGLGSGAVEAAYDLDQIGTFYDEGLDGIVVSMIFAVRVGGDVAAAVSHEHDALEWVDAATAEARSVWPAYRESIARIQRLAAEPAWARWFELDRDGRRIARPPTRAATEPT